MKNITILILFLFCFYTGKAQVQVEQERYSINNISVNNVLSNFGPAFYQDNQLVFATPAKRNYIINNTWKGNDQPFLEVKIGTIGDDGELSDVKNLSRVINTKFHEAYVTFSKDFKTVYFTRSNYFERKYRKDSLGINRLKIFKSTQGIDGNWSKVTDMPFNNDEYSTGHPTLSEDGQTLYFISDMPGTLGKTDIFKVAIHEDGSYGDPVNLGSEINTEGKEMFPYITENDELYFSSDGRNGLGMLDVYMSKLENNQVISTLHLEAPINSDWDDFAFIINPETLEGYFSSNRMGGKGDDDIYYFKENLPIICTQSVTGLVKDKESRLLLPGTLVSLYKDNIKIDSLTTTVGEEATFEFPLDCEASYKIVGSKLNYLDATLLLNTDDEHEKVHEVELALQPDEEFIVVGDRILLKINTIYFDFDKSFIRPDASLELNKAIEIMKKYPEIVVEFGAHCDSRGPDRYNEKLSGRRANSTVEYMLARGITKDRLTGKGYGETMLVNKCANGVKCTEDEHQLNRRTEFLITNPEVIQTRQ